MNSYAPSEKFSSHYELQNGPTDLLTHKVARKMGTLLKNGKITGGHD